MQTITSSAKISHSNCILFFFAFLYFILLPGSIILADSDAATQVHSKRELLRKNDNIDFYIYAFADVSSCSTWILDLKGKYQHLQSKFDIQITLFVSGIQPEQTSEIISTYDIDEFKVVADPIFLYKNYYGVIDIPTAIIYNFDGEEIFRGISNAKESDSSVLLELMKNNKKESPKNLDATRNNITIEKSDKWIYAEDRFLLYSKKRNELMVVLSKPGLVMQIDSVGNIIDEINLTKGVSDFFALYKICWFDNDENHFCGIRQRFSNFRNFYTYNLANKTINNIDIKYDSIKALNSLNHLVNYDISGNNILIGQYPKYQVPVDLDSLNTTLIFDTKSSRIRTVGNVEEFYKGETVALLSPKSCIAENKIFEVQGVTPQINVYALDDSDEKHLPINFDNRYWRKFPSENYHSETTEKEDDINFYNSISFIEDIIPIEDQKLAIVYYNVDYYSTDSNKIDIRYYVHITNFNGDKLLKYDLDLGKGARLFYIDDYKYGINIFLDGEMYISWKEY